MPTRRTTPDPAPAEPTPEPTPELTEAQDRFIESWSRMAGVWGISPTMAQVHALLFITGRPMSAEDIMARLSISRGNVSMTLRALLDWGVVSKAPVPGQRREFFRAEQDAWAMFRTIARERIKREVEPLRDSLAQVRRRTPAPKGAKAPADPSADEVRQLNQRLDDVAEVLDLLTALNDRFTGPGGAGLRAAAKLLGATRRRTPPRR